MNTRQVAHQRVRRLPWAALVCGLLVPGTTTQADSLIIPAEYADREGPVAFGSNVPPGITPRFQLLYYGFEFPAGPIDITGFRLRPKAYTGNLSVEYKDLQVSLTTTNEMSLEPDFQSNLDNGLQAPTVVIDGDLVTETTRQRPPRNPKDFDYEFTWEATPFRYDPADGMNILLDLNFVGGVFVSPSWDAASAGMFRYEGELLNRIVLDGHHDSRFPITEILYTPVQEGQGPLQAGDADQDLDFDQLDLVKVQQASTYLTGEPATWGQGDWNGAPGGRVGKPPEGDGLFNQLDIVAAQQAGLYLTGPYSAVLPNGQRGDGQTSIIYNANMGEVAVDAPPGTNLTSINIDSAAGIFTGGAATNLGGSFDNDADNNIFKATFGSSFGSLSFGNVAQAGLSEQFVLNDLTVIGSLAGGGDLGNVDLVYVPEPTSALLLSVAIAVGLLRCRRVNKWSVVW
jgi:hypothetical protein